MGQVSTVYYTSGGYDLVSIKGTTWIGYVWNGSGQAAYGILGQVQPLMVGDGVTFDGGFSQITFDVPVNKVNYCQSYTGGWSTCHVTQATSNSTDVCAGGDSGGPVITRVSGGYYAFAAGTIVGGGYVKNKGYQCEFQMINYIMTEVNGTLMTAPS